jgi:hypothetical protein
MLHSDYAALLLRLDSLQHSHSLSSLEPLLWTLTMGGYASMCFTLPLTFGHLVQHKSSRLSTPIV